MKHIIILGDGMADEPIEKLGGKTPLQSVTTPAMDFVATNGRCGLLATVPEGFTPGSEIANLGILGYDVLKVYEGRGSLEAASMQIPIADGMMAMRCNLVSIDGDRLKNHSSGHITTQESRELIAALNEALGNDTVTFHPGVSYRHVLTIQDGDKHVDCTPPHDVPGALVSDILPKAENTQAEPTAALLRELMMKSADVLRNHPVNIERRSHGKDTADMIWPWSPGYRPKMQTLAATYGIKRGVVISAVDLIRGIGALAGLEIIDVPGITGLYDTNYEGKAEAAINALRNGADFVFLHIEASDEAGHEGDVDLKMRTIENLDRRIVKPIIEATHAIGEPLTIALLPDHPTPCRLRTHTAIPVPFAVWNPLMTPDSVTNFDELSAANGYYGLVKATEFMNLLMK